MMSRVGVGPQLLKVQGAVGVGVWLLRLLVEHCRVEGEKN